MVIATRRVNNEVVDVNAVEEATGVQLWQLSKEDGDVSLHNDFVQRFDVTLTDSIHTNKPLGELSQTEYEEELARFRRPHYHLTDEVRFIKEGSCYFDVRSNKEWFRLLLQVGDVLCIPARLVHSVDLGETKFVKASGYYKAVPGVDSSYVPRYESSVSKSVSGPVEQFNKLNSKNAQIGLKQV